MGMLRRVGYIGCFLYTHTALYSFLYKVNVVSSLFVCCHNWVGSMEGAGVGIVVV